MTEGTFQLLLLSTILVVSFLILHVALDPQWCPWLASLAAADGPTGLFDHPEPNGRVGGVAEYFAAATVAPLGGGALAGAAARHGHPAALAALAAHTAAMYAGAFAAHATLRPEVFRWTVTNVVWNAIAAFALMGEWVPVGGRKRGMSAFGQVRQGTWLERRSGVRRMLAVGGAVVAASSAAYLPEYLGPNGGFVLLSLLQPPFVFLGLASVAIMRHTKTTSSGKCPTVALLWKGAICLMFAMVLGAIEVFVDPLLIDIPNVWSGGPPFTFPLLHVAIHVVEQVGIYMYGVGTAAMFLLHVEGRREDCALVIGNKLYNGFHCEGEKTQSAAKLGWYLLPYVATKLNSTESEAMRVGEQIIQEHDYLRRSQYDEYKDAVKKSDSAFSALLPIDLLNRAVRCDPHTFYLHKSTRWIDLHTVVPCAYETRVKAIFNVDLIEHVLQDDVNFSSNPFGDDAERYIGLSTTQPSTHQKHARIVGPFFNEQRLKKLSAEAFSGNATYFAEGSFANGRQGISRGTQDCVVQFAYRVVISNGLCALGLPESLYRNVGTVDEIIKYSNAMVAATAPVGGSGPRRRLTFSMFYRMMKSIVRATPSTLTLIRKLGWSESWKLFRPDTTVLKPMLGLEDGPRGNFRQHPEAFVHAPDYFNFLIQLWRDYCQEGTIFHALQTAVDGGGMRLADGLAIVAQLLIGMTASNGIVATVKRLMRTPSHPLHRAWLPTDADNVEAAKLRAPIGDDDVRGIFDGEHSFAHFCAEVLRVDAPLQRMPRRVVNSCHLPDGSWVNRGDHLILFIGAANLTEKLGGPSIRPFASQAESAAASAASLSFGRGLHRCIGRALTQMDVQTAVVAFFSFFYPKGPNAANAISMAEKVLWVRRNFTLDLGDMLYDVDVGNYGHTTVLVKANH